MVMGGCAQQDKGSVVGRAAEQVAEPFVPGARAEGAAQGCVEVLAGAVVDEAPGRAGLAGGGVEEEFGS